MRNIITTIQRSLPCDQNTGSQTVYRTPFPEGSQTIKTHTGSVPAIVLGLALLKLRQTHGSDLFYRAIDGGVPGFGRMRVDKLIHMASNPVLANPQYRGSIPVSERPLGWLADVSPASLESGIRTGRIHASLTEESARDFALTCENAGDPRNSPRCNAVSANTRACALAEVILQHVKSWEHAERYQASELLHALAEQIGAEEDQINPEGAGDR